MGIVNWRKDCMEMNVANILSEAKIPQETKDSINLYVTKRIHPDGFLMAVFENNLISAIARGDNANLLALPAIVIYLTCHVPTMCYGNKDKVESWLNNVI